MYKFQQLLCKNCNRKKAELNVQTYIVLHACSAKFVHSESRIKCVCQANLQEKTSHMEDNNVTELKRVFCYLH